MNRLSICTLSWIVIMLTACGNHNEYKPMGGNFGMGRLNPTPLGTFAEVKAIVLHFHCLGCHDGLSGDAADFTTYAAVMSDPDRIIPGNAAESRFYKLLVNGKMPKGRPKLPEEMIKLVETWINNGAPE